MTNALIKVFVVFFRSDYLYVINESITKDDLQNKQGEFTKNKYEIVLQNDGSLIIHSGMSVHF